MIVAQKQMTDGEPTGSNTEFEELYRAHRDRLTKVALRLTRHADRADDVVSEAFLRAWKSYGRFRGEASFGTWVHRILTNIVYDSVPRIEAELPEIGPAATGPGPEDDAEASEIRSRIDEALTRLTSSQRQVFLLREVDGKRHAEIGRILGIAENTAKVHYFHALKRLREELHDLV